MSRFRCFSVKLANLVLIVFLLLGASAGAVTREWDDEGATSNWSEGANWTDDLLPEPGDDASIGLLADAFDDVVVFDLPGDTIQSFELVNGADFDTNSGRLVASGSIELGTGPGAGTTPSVLIVRPRTGVAVFAIDSNTLTVGPNGVVSLQDGEIDVDGTGAEDGVLSIAAGGTLHGYGQVELSDSDTSLGEITNLLLNDGSIVAGVPLPGVGEPAGGTMLITASNASEFGRVALGGSSGLGSVLVNRNATLKVDPLASSPEVMTLQANSTFEIKEAMTFSGTLTIDSGIVSPETPNELPALPAIVKGDGIFTTGGPIDVSQTDEELIFETRVDGQGGVLTNSGVVRFLGGGGIRGLQLTSLDAGVIVNESSAALNLQSGGTYDTPLTNAGVLGILEFDGSATAQLDSFSQTDLGTLRVDITGLLDGEFDVLAVEEEATIDGALEVLLDEMFVPSLGDSFTILTTDTGNVSGMFDMVELPTFGGLTFDVVYNPQSIELQVVENTTDAGDFDMDGDIDGADFLVWQRGAMPSSSDLADWQEGYGAGDSLGAVTSSVPEPTAMGLLTLGLAVGLLRRQQFS